MQRQAQGLPKSGAQRQHCSGIGQGASLVRVAQRLDQATRRELQETEQRAQRLGGTDPRRRQVAGMVEHHRRVAVGAGEGNLRPGLELVAGFLGRSQRGDLHERPFGVEQPEVFAPVLEVVADGLQRQAIAVPGRAVLVLPAAWRPSQGTVGDCQQQAVLSNQARRRGFRQGCDLIDAGEGVQEP
ncbi:hypothetical protein D9M70_539630 [compost metagenome]